MPKATMPAATSSNKATEHGYDGAEITLTSGKGRAQNGWALVPKLSPSFNKSADQQDFDAQTTSVGRAAGQLAPDAQASDARRHFLFARFNQGAKLQ
jgi:hypothetical protein